MKSWLLRFNRNLLLVLAILLLGCETTKPAKKADASKDATTKSKSKKEKKELSTIDFFLEIPSSGNSPNSAPIYRSNPIYVSVQSQPFLSLGSVTEASVVDHMDGFAIQIKFDSHGAFVLDTTTTANKGRRIAIHSRFPEPRWLAAPQIIKRNATGMLTFTPDATKEEAERFVRGLKNALVEYKKRGGF